jgi:hypothetical protein
MLNILPVLIAVAAIVLAFTVFCTALLALHSVAQLVVFVLFVFGVVRSWQASWLLGLIALLCCPVALVVGVASLVANRNVGTDIVALFKSSR